MIFDEEQDWKECLGEDAQQILADLFDKTRKYKCAYCQAEDVKVAQLWCALIEVVRELNATKDAASKLAEPFKAIVEMGEIEKRKTVERLVRDMIKPEPDHEEATQRLVDSLMKF